MRRIKNFVLPNPGAAAAENPMGDRIIGAAFKLFIENGYAGTSMLEIGTQAKVSKRDLYANFAAKQAVLLACITNRAARMRLFPDLPAQPRDACFHADELWGNCGSGGLPTSGNGDVRSRDRRGKAIA